MFIGTVARAVRIEHDRQAADRERFRCHAHIVGCRDQNGDRHAHIDLIGRELQSDLRSLSISRDLQIVGLVDRSAATVADRDFDGVGADVGQAGRPIYAPSESMVIPAGPFVRV